MDNREAIIKKMLYSLNEQKRSFGQIKLVINTTVTDIYRIDSYIEQISSIIRELNRLFVEHERMKSLPQTEKQQSPYIKLINDISTELHYLNATYDAMDDTLRELQAAGKIQCKISGRFLALKKEISSAIKKAEEILR